MYLQTGQISCHDTAGHIVPCTGSGQDGESRAGLPWPTPRFKTEDGMVLDRLTGLVWTRDANLARYPLMWSEALDRVARFNAARLLGHDDWCLPNRRELRSLVSHQTRRPALPKPNPFINVFAGWYWSSTTAAISPAHAWYVDMDGGRMFYGGKDQSFMLWPVRGDSRVLAATGQTRCYNALGAVLPCTGSGQDGAVRSGRSWPRPRFNIDGETIVDTLTGLGWRRVAGITDGPVAWLEAIKAVRDLNATSPSAFHWRLPNINELESLVDCDAHGPALPVGHPFAGVSEAYWSSTTSLYEPDWAWALYLDKGAIGVGQKAGRHFSVWTVADASSGSGSSRLMSGLAL
ncbi:MAG: hypothetical protein COS39_07590 [Hydrogenophilales bacterium CG03_land_8_20_14_0_80_62_28]|nr:MAG: hypothetical protein AUJ86_04055 [Hydrogenophilaceae bacterium CG1_02_62_390]PIV22454.1 MAG: hypothetical protein COS39_07590 [Hydrogenophilales bacterium CG03_land_8_20_14_0_80_62_28]PIW38765.1 MAG: hypothetical protein COW23_04860 [Hydrogenophilales bacterium CG15_BIG_FIL_POST_REV_8_21_14_020_62_31]PIW72429.1 MAG: hypothetical protein COW07_03075 [Hydrogenophilales bacterium CG12_big_fil_rev_8_21_14_0_65_61_21]PIX00867.1 MAG: hypothetical protein COZ79_09930 [Hydrogenophilales bacteri